METGEGEALADESVRQAAVAEGFSAAQAGLAEEAAGDAKAAAEVALEAAQANIESVGAAAEAGAVAQEAAASAASSEDRIYEALTAQTAAITAFLDEMRASRQTPVPTSKPRKSKRDRSPGSGDGGTRLVRR